MTSRPSPSRPPLSRQERRLRDREDERLLRQGIPPRGDGLPVLAMARRLHRILAGSATRRASDAAAAIHEGFERSLARHPASGIACRKGCAWCCSSHVAVTAPEAFLIAARLGGPRGAEAAQRIAAADAANARRSREERITAPLPCALLTAEGTCSVYEVRPSACRSLLSFDVTACERTFGARTGETVPAHGAAVLLRTRYQAALRAALAVVGLPPVSWELAAAVNRVLGTADAEARWLMGEDVFAGIEPESTVKPDFDASVRDLAAALRADAG